MLLKSFSDGLGIIAKLVYSIVLSELLSFNWLAHGLNSPSYLFSLH